MIHYLVLRPNAHTIRTYLETWRRELLERVSIEFYDDLPCRRTAMRGTYIFSDIERLSDAQRELAQTFADQLKSAGCRVLNEPKDVLCRYELLRLLHERGINSFAAHRLSSDRSKLRFPVFLREANEHTGSLTPLVNTPAELEHAIQAAIVKGSDARNLLIVEYCDTADASGIFRKYSAMMIGDALVPRHVLFSREWVDKTPDLVDVQKVAEEVVYQKLNPHERELREIFDLAHISYGRIDYAMLDGKIQVWEINTNPVVLVAPSRCDPERLPGQARSGAKIAQALESLDCESDREIPIVFPNRLLNRLGVRRSRRFAAAARRHLKRLRSTRPMCMLAQTLNAL